MKKIIALFVVALFSISALTCITIERGHPGKAKGHQEDHPGKAKGHNR